MTESSNSKNYDLEERTFKFNKSVVLYSKKLPRNSSNLEYVGQVIRSSGSIGANYTDANELLSKKDFLMRAKICRKEAKETVYWLKLLQETNIEEYKSEAVNLIDEATQLKKIFSAIVEKGVN